MAKCKRCGLKTVLSEDDIQKMVEQVTSMKSVRLVSSDVYENRFDICQICDDFMYGNVRCKRLCYAGKSEIIGRQMSEEKVVI